jgi:hypothetical protein
VRSLTPVELAERRRYADRALAVLRQAVALGLKDAQAVRRDPDMAPLRGRPDFERLVAELAKRERTRRE